MAVGGSEPFARFVVEVRKGYRPFEITSELCQDDALTGIGRRSTA